MIAEKIKVSVIVPVYNGEEYLSRAVDSILAQTLKEIEIILVDDGSEDGTGKIIKEYKKRYPGLIVDVYNKYNCSLGSARNIGVSHASGEYLGFVDADDWIDSDFYEKMYEKAKNTDADIVRCGLMRVNDEGKMWIHSLPPESWDTRLDDASKRRIVIEHFWGMKECIFRRKTWVESGFRVIEQATYDEDMTSVLLVLCANRMAIIREPIYKYWINPTGTGSFNEFVYEKSLCSAEKVLREAKRLGVFEDYREELIFFTIRSCFLNFLAYMEDKKIYPDFPCRKLCLIAEGLEKMIPGYIYNRYLCELVPVRAAAILRIGLMGVSQAEYFFHNETGIIEHNTYTLLKKYENSRIAIWGAAQRGNDFLERYDKYGKIISRVFDKNESLYGKRMKTGHCITSFEDHMDEVDVVFVMNHRYYSEIASNIKDTHKVELIDYEQIIYQLEKEYDEIYTGK